MIETRAQVLARIKREASIRAQGVLDYAKNLPVGSAAPNRNPKLEIPPSESVSEATESTKLDQDKSGKPMPGSVGGQNPQQKWRKKNRKKLNEYQKKWRAKRNEV